MSKHFLFLMIGCLLLFFLQTVLAYPARGLQYTSFPSSPTGTYPTYMALRYGVYSGGNYQHAYTASGDGWLTQQQRIRVIRGQYPYQTTYGPSQRNYYTTDYPSTNHVHGFPPPYQRKYYGGGWYY